MWVSHLNVKEYARRRVSLKVECLCKSEKVYGKFTPGLHLARFHLTITGQYCGRLLKFSAHSLNVLGIRYKVFKYVFLLIISYIHIYETIFQICFFYWWYHIYIYTRPYWDAISWDNSYMMIIWSTWPLKIPNT